MQTCSEGFKINDLDFTLADNGLLLRINSLITVTCEVKINFTPGGQSTIPVGNASRFLGSKESSPASNEQSEVHESMCNSEIEI